MSTVVEAVTAPVVAVPTSRLEKAWRTVRTPFASVAIAVAVTGLLLLAAGYDPLTALRYFFLENFTSSAALSRVVVTATPLLILAVSVSLAFRAGIFNIGQEGQLYVGACAGTLAALQLSALPGSLMILVALVVAAVAGALWAGIMGSLKAYFSVDEIVTSLMLNYIAILLTRYIVTTWFKAPGLSVASETLPEKAWWPHLPGSDALTWGASLAAIASIGAWILLFRTSWGLKLRAVGSNARFAEAVGTRPARVILLTALLSGAVAGVAGVNTVLAGQHQFVQGFSPGYGWAGLAVALLARLHPFGAIAMAILYASLLNGSGTLQIFTEVPGEFVNVVIGLVVLLVTAQWRRSHRRTQAD